MQRTMLADKRAAVHAHDIILRECFLQGPPGFHVLVRLIISRIKHGCVGYQKISVGGGQTFTIFIILRRKRTFFTSSVTASGSGTLTRR